MLLTAALEDAALHVNSEAPALRGSGLEMLARKYMEVQAIIARWSRRYDDRLLEQLLYMPETASADFDRADWLRGWIQDLDRRLNVLNDGTAQLRDHAAARPPTARWRASTCIAANTAAPPTST